MGDDAYGRHRQEGLVIIGTIRISKMGACAQGGRNGGVRGPEKAQWATDDLVPFHG